MDDAIQKFFSQIFLPFLIFAFIIISFLRVTALISKHSKFKKKISQIRFHFFSRTYSLMIFDACENHFSS